VTSVPVTGVTLPPAETIGVAHTLHLTAVLQPANATNQTASWISSSPGVATVSGTGLTGTVTGMSPGTANITVTTQDGSRQATCAVQVLAATTPDVYLGGTFGLTKNGVSQSAYDGCTVRAIYVDGSNVLHVAGIHGDEAVYYRNGVRTNLPRTGATAAAYALCVSGADVYVAGDEYDGGYRAKLWKNSVNQPLGGLDAGFTHARGVSVIGGAIVLVAGNHNASGASDGEACVWMNGTKYPTGTTSNVYGMAIADNGIGYLGTYSGCVWFNYATLAGDWVGGWALPTNDPGHWSDHALAVCTKGSSFYWTGWRGLEATWGTPYENVILPRPAAGGYAEAYCIQVTPVGDMYICGMNSNGAALLWVNEELQDTGQLGRAYAVFAK